MRNIKLTSIPSVLILMLLLSCGNTSENSKVSDKVTIGKQIWMAKNLNVDKFRNGDPIPEAKTDDEWRQAIKNKKPAWCYYNNDPENGEIYGKIYNIYAINDSRGLAPEGWSIPTNDDWNRLVDFLGGMDNAANKLKSNSYWDEKNNGKSGNGNNESGFSSLPGGGRDENGRFYGLGDYSCLISSTMRQVDENCNYSLSNELNVLSFNLGGVFSSYVRCISDSTINDRIDNKVQKETATEEITIGNQIWMARNLDVTKFLNGDSIPVVRTPEELYIADENKQPACCYYNNNSDNASKHGRLYNWHAINDPRGLAPQGWRIPTLDDWNKVVDFLGGKSLAGDKMKSKEFWADNANKFGQSGNGNNSSGFSGLPSGFLAQGGFSYLGNEGNWWSATEHGDKRYAWAIKLTNTSSEVTLYEAQKYLFFSIRCIKN